MIDERSTADGYDGYEDDDRGPSKSARKREMHRLQALGEQLVALSTDQLAKVPLPDDLRTAVREARRITKHEARRRQMQYIGRLMRHADAEPIQAQLDVFMGLSKEEVARQHRLERLRSDFLDDEQCIGRIAAQWPAADLQHLRALRRNALKEREHDKPPRAFRELFRMLRELDAGGVAPTDESEHENDTDPTESS